MSKTISIADDVYDWLKREKDRDGKSFSEVIRNLKPRKPRFAECNGAGLTDQMSDVQDSIEDASETTKRRLDDVT
jgi:predicted CopG family antitoxin